MAKKRKSRLLAMYFTAFAASFFISATAVAADGDADAATDSPETIDMTQGPQSGTYHDVDTLEHAAVFTSEKCEGGCKGHIIQGGSTSNKIHVVSGTHTITLNGITITGLQDNECAFAIDPNATVNLILQGNDNNLTSGEGRAGIAVPDQATLTISEHEGGGSLNVTAQYGGAGIGGEGFGSSNAAGTITINSGTIVAKGGGESAGIGGNRGGGAGIITINGGTVEAYGGSHNNSVPGGAGIGCGSRANPPGNVGTITINAGTVKAVGGKNANQEEGYSLNANSLSSAKGSGIVLTANNVSPRMDKNNFNGIIWNTKIVKNDSGQDVEVNDICYVYGEAVLPKPFNLDAGQTMSIDPNASLTIPADLYPVTNKWGFHGSIIGGKGSSIVNADLMSELSNSSLSDLIDLKVVLLQTDFIIEEDPAYATYTGIDLLRQGDHSIYRINPYRWVGDQRYIVDQKGWNVDIKRAGSEESLTQVINAGNYTAVYSKAGLADIKIEFEVFQRNLEECTFAPVEPQSYTGELIKPGQDSSEPMDIRYNGKLLLLGQDYTLGYGDEVVNVNVGNEAWVAVNAAPDGNYTGSHTINFTISPASLSDATVALSSETADYNGERQELTVEVRDGNGKLLTQNTDYTVEPDLSELVDAGVYPIVITGMGNYGGNAPERTFTIVPISVDVKEVQAKGRPYDGTCDVEIESMKVDENRILPIDRDKVNLEEFKGVTGKIAAPDVGTYDMISFENMTLGEGKGKNYLLNGTNIPIDPITITQRKGPTLSVEAEYEINPENGVTFLATVSGHVSKDDVQDYPYVYEYRMDGGDWQPAPMNVYTVEPGSTHTFAVRTRGDDNIAAGESNPTEITFYKQDQEPPASCTIESVTENANGLYTLTITPVANALYSFDGKNFTENNIITNAEPGTEYKGYIKFKENVLQKESPVTESEPVTTGTPTVQDPIITPNGSDFYGKEEVTIECGTAEAEIYYTTNGADPTTSSTRYEEPFTVSDTVTVKAIAIRDGMLDSGVVSASFNKVGELEVQTRVELVPITAAPPALMENPELNTPEGIIARLTSILSSIPGYEYQNMAFYELTVYTYDKLGDRWMPVTVDNFPTEGLTITIPYPLGTDMNTNDFVVSHMYGETSERLGVTAGNTEEPVVTKTAEGIQFAIHSASPLGVAWKTADGVTPSDGNNPDGNNPDGSNPDGSNPDGSNPDGNNSETPGDGDPTAYQDNPNGNNTTTTNGTEQNAGNESNAVKDAVSAVLPKTGDPITFLPWIGAAAASIAAITFVRARGRSRKKSNVKKKKK